MPRWLLETIAQVAIVLIGAGHALIVTLAYAITWFGNGGAVGSEVFDPVFQAFATVIWVIFLVFIVAGARSLLQMVARSQP